MVALKSRRLLDGSGWVVGSDVSVCLFDGLNCPSLRSCLADILKPSGSVARCSRFVFSRKKVILS